MSRLLGEVVVTCVNRVGADLNTTSAPLLSYIAGISPPWQVHCGRRGRGQFTRPQLLSPPPGRPPSSNAPASCASGMARIPGCHRHRVLRLPTPGAVWLLQTWPAGADSRTGQQTAGGEETGPAAWRRTTLRDIIRLWKNPPWTPGTDCRPLFREGSHPQASRRHGPQGTVRNTDFGAFGHRLRRPAWSTSPSWPINTSAPLGSGEWGQYHRQVIGWTAPPHRSLLPFS